MDSQLYLFRDRRFLPLFISQFCGCFNDCIFKSALIIMITYHYRSSSPSASEFLILIVNAVFVLPFVVFGGIAGQLSDKYRKDVLIKMVKFSEVIIVALGLYGFSIECIWILMIAVALMGMHSTIFGPLKYSIIPDHMDKNELLSANGYIESGTFAGILLGSLIGILYNSHPFAISTLMMALAIFGLIASLLIPVSNNYNPHIVITKNILKENWNLVKYSYSKQTVFLSILGTSWFWFIGASFLSQIPPLTREALKANESVVQLFLGVFSVGVGMGSFFCGRILHNELTTKYVFISVLTMGIVGIDLFLATNVSSLQFEPEELRGIWPFISKLHNFRLIFDMFLISFLGGMYTVPLYAVMQFFSPPSHRSRIIAASNILQAVFMITSTIVLSILFYVGCSINFAIFSISLLNFLVACYIYSFLPENHIVPRGICILFSKIFLKTFFRIKVTGLHNVEKAPSKLLIICNHVSYLDGPIIATYIPGPPAFAINTVIAKKWYFYPFLQLIKSCLVDPNHPIAIKNLIKILKSNKRVAIFPEGRVTTTGQIMKVYDGPGMIAHLADCYILPIHISGFEESIFSSVPNKTKRKIFCKVRMNIMEAFKPDQTMTGMNLYNKMLQCAFESLYINTTIPQAIIDAASNRSSKYKIANDYAGSELTYKKLLQKAFVLGNFFQSRHVSDGLGLMLPTSIPAIAAITGMQFAGLFVMMINFTSGIQDIIHGCRTANIKTIYTSRQFVEKAHLQHLVDELHKSFELVYLEDIANKISTKDKLVGLLYSTFPKFFFIRTFPQKNINSQAFALLTSGTEGMPKVVALSHANILYNVAQTMLKLDINFNDRIFNALPMFHCFGLGISILCLTRGISACVHPSPLQYKIIPEAFYDSLSTVMFATDTFLNQYAKFATRYDFHQVKYVFVGAEKLRQSTKEKWLEKFGICILEGYGATEASPVISINTKIDYKEGSVGKLLPGIKYKVDEQDNNSLVIKGPNVMLGYMDGHSGIKAPFHQKYGHGWYNTGDVVEIDQDGYCTIIDRNKRFAKVAGEMISMAKIEQIVSLMDPDKRHAAVFVQDESRGEIVVLFTTSETITKEKIVSVINEKDISRLYIPKIVVYIEDIPALPTGKIDYKKLAGLASEHYENHV